MSVTLELPEQADIAAAPRRPHRRFTVAEYQRMIALDILTEQDSCELIRGEILEKHWSDGLRVRPHHRFSVDVYERMIESGILTKSDRVELIRGEILEKMTIGEPHSACVMRLNRLFSRLIGDRVIVGVQSPVSVADSCPEPDLTLLAYRGDFYSESSPSPADIFLLIEVADSSLNYDRNEKLSLYAEAGVQEYWIANVSRQCLEVYRDPQPDGTYAEQRIVTLGEQTDILAIPGVTVAVNDIFKPGR